MNSNQSVTALAFGSTYFQGYDPEKPSIFVPSSSSSVPRATYATSRSQTYPNTHSAPLAPKDNIYPNVSRSAKEVPDDSENDSEDDGSGEKSKVEIRREKNRVKQRNLRLRRANHITDLETTVTSLRGDNASLAATIDNFQQREKRLTAWIEALQEQLYRFNPAAIIENRNRFGSTGVDYPPQATGRPLETGPILRDQQRTNGGISNTPGVDLLETLAHAASAVQRPPAHVLNPHMYPSPNQPHPHAYPQPGPPLHQYPQNSHSASPSLSSHFSPLSHQVNWPHQASPDTGSSNSNNNKRKWSAMAVNSTPLPPYTAQPILHSDHSVSTPPQPIKRESNDSNRSDGQPDQSRTSNNSSLHPTPSNGTSILPSPLVIDTNTFASPVDDEIEALISPKSMKIASLLSPHPNDSRVLSSDTPGMGDWSWDAPSQVDNTVTPLKPIAYQMSQASMVNEMGMFLPAQQVETNTGLSLVGAVKMDDPTVPGIFGWSSEKPLGVVGQLADPQVPLPWDPSSLVDVMPQGPPTIFNIPLESRHNLIPSPAKSTVLLSTPIHAAVLQARTVLSVLYPSPLPRPLPSLMTYNLSPQQQLILLIGLTHLSSPKEIAFYRSEQVKSLPPDDGQRLISYQTSPQADPRLALFPIAILRSKIILVLHPNSASPSPESFAKSPKSKFNLTNFLSDVLSSVTIFGNPNDTNAWDLPDHFWDRWESWFPVGRAYCKSLRGWRMREGHGGSGVGEMLLGIEGEGARMEGPIGKPAGW